MTDHNHYVRRLPCLSEVGSPPIGWLSLSLHLLVGCWARQDSWRGLDQATDVHHDPVQRKVHVWYFMFTMIPSKEVFIFDVWHSPWSPLLQCLCSLFSIHHDLTKELFMLAVRYSPWFCPKNRKLLQCSYSLFDVHIDVDLEYANPFNEWQIKA